MSNKILFCATVDYHFKAFHLPYLKWFKEQGWEVHVAASGEIELPYVDQKFNIPIQRSPFKFKNIDAYNEMKKIIKQNQYKIIHCHTPMGGILARFAARKARKQGTKVIYTAHGFHFCKGAPLMNWLTYYHIEKWMANYTDCLITINQEDYQLATSNFKVSQIEHVHGVGVDSEQFVVLNDEQKRKVKKSFGYQPGDFLLFYAAEFNKNKNQQFLIQSLALIKGEVPNMKLLLAGDGLLLEECKKLTSQLGIEDMIDFLGYRDDVKTIVSLCDVVVASSLREGLPVNIMEAMASGLPIVASENRGHRELVSHNVNGFLVEPNHAQTFGEHLLELYQSSILCEKMGRESLNKVKDYSLPKVSKELFTIYSRFMVEDKDVTKSKYNRAYI